MGALNWITQIQDQIIKYAKLVPQLIPFQQTKGHVLKRLPGALNMSKRYRQHYNPNVEFAMNKGR